MLWNDNLLILFKMTAVSDFGSVNSDQNEASDLGLHCLH